MEEDRRELIAPHVWTSWLKDVGSMNLQENWLLIWGTLGVVLFVLYMLPKAKKSIEKAANQRIVNSSSYSKQKEEMDARRKAAVLRQQDELREQSRIDLERRKTEEEKKKQQRRITTQELLDGKSNVTRVIPATEDYGSGSGLTRRSNIHNLPSDSCSTGS
eukprot:TRINITY_DN1048_c0_g1_i1.p1 TRINITY_DN1048_c0_g1~~TRINITY_DN1048_c0_g1_i1.p1  ORF type:complete len:161 (-),score=46.59 TRINITY_DN1048_c0_g1_i1:204-686(-)